MRLVWLGATLCTFLTVNSATVAQPPPQMEFTGSWTFTWDNDSKNANAAVLKHEGGTITGTYINDAKEKCPVVGRMNSSANSVTLTITCPRWDIKCDGSIKSLQLVAGRYAAYGSASGDFQMSRK